VSRGGVAAGICTALVLIGPADAAARTYVSERFGSPGPRERPATIAQGADATYGELDWSSWGGRTASAAGTFHGLGTSYAVRVMLSRPRACGRHRLYTRAVARRTDGTAERHAIANVGCRVVLLGGIEGTEEPRLTALERPSSIPRPPGEPLRGLSWKRWTRPVARARGRTVEGGERKPVRIVASRPGYCAAVGALAYRKLRVVLGSSAYTLRFAGQCRD
jgi:hypothetical protein